MEQLSLVFEPVKVNRGDLLLFVRSPEGSYRFVNEAGFTTEELTNGTKIEVWARPVGGFSGLNFPECQGTYYLKNGMPCIDDEAISKKFPAGCMWLSKLFDHDIFVVTQLPELKTE